MKVLRTCTAAIASAALLAGVSTVLTSPANAAAAASRFDDGSFEYPKAPANAFLTYTAGQAVGPWEVAGGSVDLIGKGFWQAAEGDQSIDLNGTAAGTVSQTFTTTPGATYTVSYALAGNPGPGQPSNLALKTGKALIDGQDFQDFSFNITGKTPANMGYVTRQFTFVATGATSTLTFVSTITGPWGPVLDNVQVRPHCCSCSTGC
ncbi:choice-of-anchor C family protein [Streptomyces sp. NPDC058001]|uniref:choice-of-anchor C family protein n=1 Tax=Streptomyces sp. NPDC058001 TaxID=3346300 RepID=UPI0036E1A9B2